MIRQSYDLDANALYIRLTSRKVARTAEIDAGTLVNLDADGGIVGIEVLQPARKWPLDEILARFTVNEDDATQLRAYFAHRRSLSRPSMPLQACRWPWVNPARYRRTWHGEVFRLPRASCQWAHDRHLILRSSERYGPAIDSGNDKLPSVRLAMATPTLPLNPAGPAQSEYLIYFCGRPAGRKNTPFVPPDIQGLAATSGWTTSSGSSESGAFPLRLDHASLPPMVCLSESRQST